MAPHEARIVCWFVFSCIGCAIFWVAFRSELNNAYRMMGIARKRYMDAGGLEHSLSLAIGTHYEVTEELRDSKSQLKVWEVRIDKIKRKRQGCLLLTPGVIAIMALFW